MRYPLALALLILCFSIPGIGQQEIGQTIDSLRQRLAVSQGPERVDILYQLADLYYNKDMKQSLSLGEEALELATNLKYDRGIQRSHSILRRVHRRLGNYSVSIDLTLKNLPISERLRDTLELMDSYTTLGNIYSGLENFRDAQYYLSKALSLGRKINSPQLANILNYLGRSYGKMGNYDSGQYYIQAALLRELEVPQAGYGLSYIYNNLAEIYYYKKEYDKAIEFYSLSTGLAPNKRSEYGMTFTLNGLALVYIDLKQYDKAIEMALQSIEIGKKNSFRDKTKESYKILYEIYELKKDFKSALAYYKQYNLYQDSIFSEDRIQYIENIKITYQTEKIAQENELLRKDAQLKDSQLNQQLMLTWVAVATIIFLLVISFLLYRNNQHRRKTNTILEEYSNDLKHQVENRTKELVNTNMELVSQNNQLAQFGYIIAHNFRGAVARILGLTGLINGKSFDPSKDQEMLQLLHSSARELDATMYDLNSILEIKKGIQNSFEIVNFFDRFKKVKSMLKDKIQESGTTLEEDFESAPTCYAVPAYIESILYNLVSNGIKYSAVERKPVIKIKTSKEGSKVILTVRDNGIGLDLTTFKDKLFTLYQRFHSHVEGKGMGLFLVKTQVEALNGTIEVHSKLNEGTSFKIQLPAKQGS
ncbi:MAG TPA: tetratricopeptide repeat protein [Cyclobacteriaceae bacterium]|nr:tetratricopeptide repeat protein [Cyclobacteriaceae bacterium]